MTKQTDDFRPKGYRPAKRSFTAQELVRLVPTSFVTLTVKEQTK